MSMEIESRVWEAPGTQEDQLASREFMDLALNPL